MVNASLRGKRFKRNFWNWVLRWEPRKIAEKRRGILLELQENLGLRAWTHFNYMHAKQIYIDRTVTSISSLNLDRASLERNHEAGAICMDDGLSEKMETQLVLDLVNSVPFTDD
jgi:phosphatidylserine/phosphatidylglycerophosphate/cardiolipin synthase-like enzyme